MNKKLNSPLGFEIQNAYQKLKTLIQTIPCDLLLLKNIEFGNHSVSIADLVAYQIGYGKRLLDWYQSGVEGTKVHMPGDGFSKWDYPAIAKHFFEKYHLDGNKMQWAFFESTVEKILSLTEIEYQNGNLDKLGVWQWCTLTSGKEWPLSKWITVNTKSPYKRAYRLISKQLNFH